MPDTLGFHSPQIRAARLLHQKKHRSQRRCFLLEGPLPIETALNAGARLEVVYLIENAPAAATSAAALARSARVPVQVVERRTIEALSQTQAPQGIVAVAEFVDMPVDELGARLSSTGPAVIIILHDLDDPGNAGTILRSAAAFGASAVCFGPHSVEPYNDKLVRAAMGSLFLIPIFRYDRWEDMAQSARSAGFALAAAEAGGPDVRGLGGEPRIALVLGNERRGLEGLPPADLTLRVGIPQTQAVESLNAAVAGSIILYELARARGLLRHANENEKR